MCGGLTPLWVGAGGGAAVKVRVLGRTKKGPTVIDRRKRGNGHRRCRRSYEGSVRRRAAFYFGRMN